MFTKQGTNTAMFSVAIYAQKCRKMQQLHVYSNQEFLNLRRYDLPIESNSLLRLLPYKVED